MGIMPELPEVETVVRELQYLQGARVERFQINDPKVWFESEFSPQEIIGTVIERVHRRGKYIIFSFRDKHLLQHLRMTGKMLRSDSPHIPENIRIKKREQIRCELLTNQGEVYFYDTRRFGTFTAVFDYNAFFQKKDIAPDSLNEEKEAWPIFWKALQKSSRPIKAVLLDQSSIAGVGNIYADEALHLQKIHPSRKANKINEKVAKDLFRRIRKIFSFSIRSGGTTVNNYLSAEGKKGKYVEKLFVYGRQGEACHSCNTGKIKMIRLAGRSTHFCPSCQAK